MGCLLKNISCWKILVTLEIEFFFGKQFDFHQVGKFYSLWGFKRHERRIMVWSLGCKPGSKKERFNGVP